ncbi:LysR family transcriptional regulator [Jiella sp. MQZ9-1]|uniref:LysR family transcriptional regulator n=1 Tax=Jiella flava TaxID=2816857 RepID=A0A939JT27_9HYPH|nr:LysR family transcriptional regulator [Jiella flava]MBO0661700.1 LysR family transcriptional regulator [Jiella flava]MCD2470342.1 LysR family transcriptional regulator [Jiella flava]
MTLEQLRIFLAVAERQHVTQAAEALNLTQSAVSAAIAALETRHAVKLFDRVGRRIELTDVGRVFVGEAREILGRVETATLVLEDLAEHTMGRIRVAASQTVASYWLPARLMRFNDRFPDVEMTLAVGNTTQVARWVVEGGADLGVVEGAVDAAELEQIIVGTDDLMVICAPGHPFADGRTLAVSDFSEASWILREEGSGTRSEFEAWFSASGGRFETLKITLELPSNEAVLAAVAAGSSVSVLSGRAAAPAVALGNIIAIPLPGAKRRFFAITHRRRHRTRALAAMHQLLKASG